MPKAHCSLLALWVLVAGVCGCGAGHPAGNKSTANAEAARIRGNDSADADNSGPGEPSENNDDREIEVYGHPAGRADRLSVTAFARRYLAAASNEDGATACSMLLPNLAKSLVQHFGGPSAPNYLYGRTCAEILAKLFKHKHKQLVDEDFAFTVTAVRVAGDKAYGLMAFARYPERRYFDLERVGRAWKLNGLLDADYP
jgi:hypothetical protein